MAIEDEIINITDIDVGTEILNNDKLIIETNNGTKLLAFKDLVIGEENITFKDKLVQGAGATGSSTTKFSTVTGYNILTSDTTAGHVIKYADISGTVELGKFNYSGVSKFASMSATIAHNESEISFLKTQLDLIKTTFSSSSALSSTALTLSAVNFYFENGSSATGSGGGNIKFTSDNITVDPTRTNANASYSPNPFSVTYPSDSSYVGGYVLFNLSYDISRTSKPRLAIFKTPEVGGTSEVWRYTTPRSAAHALLQSHSHIEYIAPGDTITVTASQFISNVRFNGFKLG